MCNCGCGTCDKSQKGITLNESVASKQILSEGLQYHINHKIPLTEHVYRAGSSAYFNLWAEARALYARNILEVKNTDDLEILNETDLGHFGIIYEIEVGDQVKASKEYGGLSGEVVDVRGSFIVVKTKEGNKSYHESDLEVLNKKGKKVPLDFPIELNEQMGIYDEIANMEFGMGYDQLGDNEKEWVRDEIDNMKMNKIAIFDGPDGMVDVYKTSEGYYFQTDDYDGEASNAKEAAKWLKDNGFVRLQAGSLDKGKMPDKYIGNDNIVYLKTKEDSRGAHYNLYYKGHDIDVGGRRFGSEKELESFAKNYILSNQMYNKLKYEKPKALPEPVNEAKKKKDNRPLGKPMRSSSGGKAYKVYVRDPKTGNIKTVRFGSGGLRAKINDPKARQAFAKRHKCSQKKDRTKASYWSCRLPRYAKLLGLKSNFSGFW